MATTTTKNRMNRKPSKPYPSFPLTAHNNGQWCKKIRGHVHFFGTWSDPQGALEKYHRLADDLHAGRQPHVSKVSSDGLTVKEVANEFLSHQLKRAESGEITARWFDDCLKTIDHFTRSVQANRLVSNLRPEDFQAYRRTLVDRGLSGKCGLGVHALERSITVVKAMFRYAYDMDLIDRPVKYGRVFDRPSAAAKRKALRAGILKNGKRLFSPREIRDILANASEPLRSMALLGINGGFGNTDCARLPLSALDLEHAIADFARPKTGVERVVPLWPETVDALRATLAGRPQAATEADADLVFLTRFGHPWVRQKVHRDEEGVIAKVVAMKSLRQELDKLLRRLGIKRKGVGFYALRHTFRTWADEVKDQHAIHRIMGHAIPGMSGIYVEQISIERLKAVTDHVRSKLFDETGG